MRTIKFLNEIGKFLSQNLTKQQKRVMSCVLIDLDKTEFTARMISITH